MTGGRGGLSKQVEGRFAPRLAAIALVIAAGSCKPSSQGDARDSGTDASAAEAGTNAPAGTNAAAASDTAERITSILRAEHRRSAPEITPADQQSRDVEVRRAAARALARISGEESRAGLLRALADEDPEVVGWAAYGLGFGCKGHEKETVAALVARALPFGETNPEDKRDGGPTGGAQLDARLALARAIGRCASDESEPTLVAWLSGSAEQASAAALALGDLAIVKERLREETIAALLHLASGSASMAPAPEGLFPIGRLGNIPETVTDRLREVAVARLATAGPYRIYAVRALGRVGRSAADDLARVLGSATTFTPAERAEAARSLGRIGSAGERALEETLPSLVPPSDPIALTAIGEELGVLLATLDAIEAPGKARKTLQALATLAPPPSAPDTLLRRLSWIRCGAAKILAGTNVKDAALVACDVTSAKTNDADAGAAAHGPTGSIGARTIVKVLDRGPIEGPRKVAWINLVKGSDARTREAAIELLAAHDELADEARPILEEALTAREPGVVTTAAEVISRKPNLATVQDKPKKRSKKKKGDAEAEAEVEKGAPSPAIVKSIMTVLERADIENDPELASAIIEAAGALGLKGAQTRLEELCRSSWPEMRKHSAKALGLITGKTTTCAAPPGGGPNAPEIDTREKSEVTIVLDTDAGEMTLVLDATIAPAAVTRVVELAKSGYYDGMVVHRVVPGFVTQFGAPFGDGYGGPPNKLPLRCETSPVAFDPLTVGVALSGRDTGSSQIFVTHARQPHLDGQYAWIGRATGPWAAFVDGDLVKKATVKQP